MTLVLKRERIEAMPAERFVHPLNDNALRLTRSLGDAVGLTRFGLHLVEVPPGRDSTEHHAHHGSDEFVYILAGQARLRLGDETVTLEAGDFAGFPASGPAHSMRNCGSEPLVYLVGGDRPDFDQTDYPRIGQRLFRHGQQRQVVAMADLKTVAGPEAPRRGPDPGR